MPAPLIITGAELVDRTGLIELVFMDPADGAEWRVAVRSLRAPVLPRPADNDPTIMDEDGTPPGHVPPRRV